ncbi:MAG: diphosphate--fructose-6-phosphate 1-phosphotransferase [Clostridiales Family XIII bacterium]|jgi:6-phosphofructokinase 1|nr:diphosphate--fructose-6-phosphate 1-phosphotransferase [Clostridiales Family XIII bacterium]
MKKNALVALGGGPSPVINASLLGVIDACRDYGGAGSVFGALHGIEGVLKEELVDLAAEDMGELAKLRYTPASGAIGTCRYKLGAGAREDYDRILDVLLAHDVGYFFYIGGNDSMDTAHKVGLLAQQRGAELAVAGVPKTIDNDLGDEARTIIDHTPGYGSTARYWAMAVKDAIEENRGMYVSEPVCVLQAMGRKAGFITAAARLADPGREEPIQLYFAETGGGLDFLYDNVTRLLRERGRAIVVVNEGYDVGGTGGAVDGFGHLEYGAGETTAAQAVVNMLNSRGLPVRGNATGQIPGVLQRDTSLARSAVDEEEAYEAGRHAVKVVVEEGSGYMATILRDAAEEAEGRYKAVYGKVPLDVVANSARVLPPGWIAEGGLDVTDAFLAYAAPLIGGDARPIPMKGGLPDFARLRRARVPKKCVDYTPQNYRI